jgi:hypothetical protein
MPDPISPPPSVRPAFPAWVVAGGLLLTALYLPTLTAPFDFLDDGNLVYPTRGLTLAEHFDLWWAKVVANVEHLGPFRPAVWVHWQVAANLFGDDPLLWRATRLGWCGLSAGLLLWFLHELRTPPVAAVLVGAAAMWNPYRNEIWTSLTLAEGVAMPYALLALVAARKAAGAVRPWRWDAVAIGGLMLALGCKNVFIALIPPMLLLRAWGGGWRTGGWWRPLLYAAPAVLPLAHFVYFKLHPRPCHYETPGPSWEQATQIVLWLKGAAGVDFLAVGGVLAAVAWGWQRWAKEDLTPRPAGFGLPLCCGLLLLACGCLVYLPVNIMCGRYTMPAVWGVDVILASALGRFLALPDSWPKRLAVAGLAVGLGAVAVAGVNRQEKMAARSRLLWELLDHVERTAPEGSTIAWECGHADGDLNAEEGIHFYWHLLHRGRIDAQVGLVDAAGRPVERVELAPLPRPPRYRIASHPSADRSTWADGREVTVRYRLGTKSYSAVLERVRVPPPASAAPVVEQWLKFGLGGDGFDPVKRLLEAPAGGPPAVAERRR